MTERERQKLIAAFSGWPPKHLLEALEQPEKPAEKQHEDRPKRGRPRKDNGGANDVQN